ncbi:unnamed protein product [Chrysoparadoxa australica]
MDSDEEEWQDPGLYKPMEYAQRNALRMLRQHVTVTGASFSSCGRYAACTSNSGRVAIWDLNQYMKREAWDDENGPDFTPDLTFEVDKSSVNCIKFVGDHLLLGGDTAVLGWKWQVLLDAMAQEEKPPQPQLQLSAPQHSNPFARGALAALPEVNALAVDKRTGHLFAATGDCNAYEWDLETQKIVKMFSGHTGYLHSVTCCPKSGLVLTGGEDGTVGLWDARSQAKPEFLRALDECVAAKHPRVCNQLKEGTPSWVSSMQVDPEGNWLSCGGGTALPQSNKSLGWIGAWHLPTRRVTSATCTEAHVQAMLYSEDSLISVGAEPMVSYWQWGELALRTRTHCSVESAYALTRCKNGEHKGTLLVGGNSPLVNVYAYPGNVAFSLKFV